MTTTSSFIVSALRSVEFGVPDVAATEDFYVKTWGLTVAARQQGVVYLRGSGTDHHLVALHPRASAQLCSVTFRATSVQALDAIALKAAQHGGQILQARAALAEPGGGESITLRDPQGRILRFVAGDERRPTVAENELPADQPVRLAHAVLNSHNVAAVQPFYEQVLGFQLSDRTGIMAFIRIPQPGFGDHHSIALADADNDCLNHVAFVMPTLEAVMRGGGRMKDAGFPIQWGPGRHGPGDNAFNYFVGPDDFVIEYTAEVEQVDSSYKVGHPQDWTWPPGRVDQWGISAPPSAILKQAQRAISFSSI